jgi:hypothetical protein
MKYLKKYESFIDDSNRDSSSIDFVPKYNPIINKGAKEYVDSLVDDGNYDLVFKIAKMNMPDEESNDFDGIFDEAKEKATKYFINNPEAIGKELNIKIPSKNNNRIPRTNNIGGTSHAASIRIGESKVIYDTQIIINNDEMELFNREEPLIDLISGGKILLGDNKIQYNKDDSKTLEILDIYFEI